MAKISLYIALVLNFLLLRVQAQTIEWSNQQKVKSKNYYTQILGQNGNGIFLLRSKSNSFNRDLTIERYKPNLSQELSNPLPQPEDSYLERMVLLESGVLGFSSKKNSQTNQVDLSCWRINENLTSFTQQTQLLSVNENEFRDNNSFYIRYSVDKSRYAVVYLTSSPTDRNGSVLHVASLSDQPSFMSRKSFALPYQVTDVFITGVEVDNQGNIYTLIDFPKNAERKGKDRNLRSFFLYALYSVDDKMLEYDLGKDSLYINELGMAVNNYDKSLCISGFYSYTKDDSRCNGHFMYTIDAASTAVRVRSFEDFDKGFISRVAGSMQNESAVALSDLYVRRIIPRSDGGCLIVAEKYYESRQTYTYYVNGFPQTSSRTMYNFDEIVVISKAADGKTQFRDFVKKKQSSISDGGYYSSFVLLNANDRLSFIYNSDISDEGDVMISTLNPKGEMNTRVLIKALSYYVTLMPPEARQVASNSIIMGTLKDKRFSLLRVTY